MRYLPSLDSLWGLWEESFLPPHGSVHGCTLTTEYSVSPDDTADESAFCRHMKEIFSRIAWHSFCGNTPRRGAGTGRRGQANDNSRDHVAESLVYSAAFLCCYRTSNYEEGVRRIRFWGTELFMKEKSCMFLNWISRTFSLSAGKRQKRKLLREQQTAI